MRKKSLWIIVVLILLLNGCVSQSEKESTEAAQQTLSPALTPTPSPSMKPTQEPTPTPTIQPQPTPTLADKFSPMPTPEKITMQIDGEVKAAIIELFAKFPTIKFEGKPDDTPDLRMAIIPMQYLEPPKAVSFDKDYGENFEYTYEARFVERVWGPSNISIFDLEDDGIPEITIEMAVFEGGYADLYKYIYGQYKKIGTIDYGYSFLKDDKGRLVLYECGEGFSDGTKYSYIDMSTGKLVKDTVYSIGAWNVEDFNYMDNIEHDFWETLYNPSALDKSVRQIPEINSTAIIGEAHSFFIEQVAKAKSNSTILLSIQGNIVSHDLPYIESDGVLYIPAQGIADFLGAKLDYDAASNKMTLTREEYVYCITSEFDLNKSQEVLKKFDISQSKETVSGRVEKMEAPPKMIDGTLMLPLKFISYAYSSAWIPEFNMVYIIY